MTGIMGMRLRIHLNPSRVTRNVTDRRQHSVMVHVNILLNATFPAHLWLKPRTHSFPVLRAVQRLSLLLPDGCVQFWRHYKQPSLWSVHPASALDSTASCDLQNKAVQSHHVEWRLWLYCCVLQLSEDGNVAVLTIVMNCILLDVLIVTIHSVLTIFNSLLQCCIITVVKQRTSQPRLYTVAHVTARVKLNCECCLATFYHLRWLYGAEWERRVIKRALLSCRVLSHSLCMKKTEETHKYFLDCIRAGSIPNV